MTDLQERDPASLEPEPIAAEEDERPTALVIAQFFLIPLVVIAVCVGLFLTFSMMTGEERDPSDYLSEVRSGSKTRRYQAAFELSNALSYDPEIARQPGFAADLARTFLETRDVEPEIRRYLALALGHVADPGTVDALLAGLDDSDSQTRIYVIWALGEVGDARAAPPLIALLGDPDPGIRKMAAHVLGSLDDPAAVPALLAALDDGEVDVQWNAALSLGQLGEPGAVPVLRRMLDRTYLDRVAGITPEQKRDVMVNAVRALVLLKDEGSAEIIARIGDGDPDPQVQAAAREAEGLLGGP